MRNEVMQLLARARRCRRTDFATPVVADVEEARALMARVAAELSRAPDQERLLCLAALREIQTVLDARTERLKQEMAVAADQMATARQGSQACLSYGAAAGLSGNKRPLH